MLQATNSSRIALRELPCPLVTMNHLLENYDQFLLDAFGVLVNSSGAIPGGREFIGALQEAGKQFLIVTNDASKLPEAVSQRFTSLGFSIPPEQILTSVSLLAPYIQANKLARSHAVVLGTPDSIEAVRRSGCTLVPLADDATYDVLVLCDDAGYPFLPTMNQTLTSLCRLYDRGESPLLLLPNPDIMYPSGDASYGFTSGGAALLLEAALKQRYPEAAPRFVRLGKPYPAIFEAAQAELAKQHQMSNARILMIGDQIETDIRGARAAGLDAALVGTGIAKWELTTVEPELAPTYRLENLAPA